jgi:hypothetical protein
MKKLADKMPKSDNVLFVFHDFEKTQDSKYSESASQHFPNLVCLQQFCSQREIENEINLDCWRCRK